MNYDAMHYPEPSRRYVVQACKGIVATSQHLAAQAGLDALKLGGNAIDAAVAAAACLTVVEPCSNGIGGDAFALVWTGGKLYGLNSSGPAPMALTAEALRALGHKEMPVYGWEPVNIPGVPAAWAALSRRFGRLTLSDTLGPAVQYASKGFAVSPVVAEAWGHAAQTYRNRLPADLVRHWYDTFTSDGRAPKSGELFHLPNHAGTLAEIGRTGAESFYRGELAARIAAFAQETGGYMTEADLTAYSPQWVEPLRVHYRGHDVWELPPNGHGMVTLMALNILEGFDPFTRGNSEDLHRQIEALKLAFADGLEYIADPAYMKVHPQELLSPVYAAQRRALIGSRAILPQPGLFSDHGTVYLATADGEGNMVSYIQSNYMGFGSGLVVPDTGISLHNRGVNFNLNPNSTNCLTPGKRPYHTIIPGFLTCEGKAVGPFGVMGGFMQPQGHMQVIINMLDYGLNPQAALDSPRWRWDDGCHVALEGTFDSALEKELVGRGHLLNRESHVSTFGRGQIILTNEAGVLTAGTDPRADSAAVAW